MEFFITEVLFPATVLAIATAIAVGLTLIRMWEKDE